MKKFIRNLLLATLVIGPVAALVLVAFEFIAIEGTDWWWNHLWHSDVERWRVIPLAIFGALVFAGAAALLRQQRLPKPATSPMAGHGSPDTPTPALMGVVLLIGAIGLMLGGASLGPEAPLMMFATLLGLWVAMRAKIPKQEREYFALVSVGALLVAFLGSWLPALLPILILLQQAHLPWNKPALMLERLKTGWLRGVALVLPILGAAAASYLVLQLVGHHSEGYGSAPVGYHFGWQDFVLAPIVGVMAVGVGWLLKKSIVAIHTLAVSVDRRVPVTVFAVLAGLGIGLFYLFGGPSVQFSGNTGSHLLLEQAPQLGLGALIGILIIKLLVTAWSTATGYRGGLIFPSIYMGVVIALIVEVIFGSAGAGVMIGAIAGIITAMGGAGVGVILLASVIPPTAGMWLLALLGVAGATLANKLLARFMPKPATQEE